MFWHFPLHGPGESGNLMTKTRLDFSLAESRSNLWRCWFDAILVDLNEAQEDRL